jgi:hypothetical protein
MAFSRLIHYRDSEGQEYFGEPDIENADDLIVNLQKDNLYASVLDGTGPVELSSASGTKKKVAEILPILEPAQVPIIKCIGLNYIKHSMSTNQQRARDY